MNLYVIAHRGMGPTSLLNPNEFSLDTLPENSIAAFKYAFRHGAAGVELDVHITKDDQVAVIHDDILNRKVFGADRDGRELGTVRDYTLEELAQFNIGNGHKIPSLKEALDLMVQENEFRAKKGKGHVIVDIELKGAHSVDETYAEIKPYLDSGLLNPEDFIFNSFEWKRLKRLKERDPRLKRVAAIKTVDLFGAENVSMPGFVLKEGVTYQAKGLEAIQQFHDEVGCYAFDCIIFDLRPEFITFCEKNNIGLLTSTSKEAIKADNIKEQLGLMIAAVGRLPFVCFRADHVGETNAILQSILDEKAAEERLLEGGGPVRPESMSRLAQHRVEQLHNRQPPSSPTNSAN
jgi:glycerophosphoryl diester phosphodiesterase